MEKKCDKCGRKVKETVHTNDSWKVDYYERSVKDGPPAVVCADCKRKAR